MANSGLQAAAARDDVRAVRSQRREPRRSGQQRRGAERFRARRAPTECVDAPRDHVRRKRVASLRQRGAHEHPERDRIDLDLRRRVADRRELGLGRVLRRSYRRRPRLQQRARATADRCRHVHAGGRGRITASSSSSAAASSSSAASSSPSSASPPPPPPAPPPPPPPPPPATPAPAPPSPAAAPSPSAAAASASAASAAAASAASRHRKPLGRRKWG